MKYELADSGRSIRVRIDEAARRRLIARTSHSGVTEQVLSDLQFNHGLKRGHTIAVTGDVPRFALLRTIPEERLDPDFMKLGDGRIRICCGDVMTWLDEADEIETTFHPGSTSYVATFAKLPKLIFRLIVSQAEDWGVAVKLDISSGDNVSAALEVEWIYGGLAICGHSYSAAYFPPDLPALPGGKCEWDQERMTAILSHERIGEQAFVRTTPAVSPGISADCASFRHRLMLTSEGTRTLYLVAGRNGSARQFSRTLGESHPNRWFEETKSYYDALVADAWIETPSLSLNAGFRTAVVNLDYVYTEPAWLEGVHFWNAYWNNNFQIPAALSLGQTERASKALRFFAEVEHGPGPIVTAVGTPAMEWPHDREEWLPYYLRALVQYVEHTGDSQLLASIWPRLRSAIEHLLSAREMKDTGLLGWHFACNPFLYQADHLGMPGDAASPSLMIAGMLERLAAIALTLDMGDDADRWRRRSDRMYESLLKELWNEEGGYFYNHVDMQDIKHHCHYYTDLVFPMLYTSLPPQYGWRSLHHLRKTLLMEHARGDAVLMRVGGFKPSVFGNDNVMPTQMAEAARALFKSGDSVTGAALLEAVAMAATVHTEAPGNFPERMDDRGKGEADYIFGNPIGSYLHSVIDGLFGLSVADGGRKMRWFPAFPEAWERAELRLPYARASLREGRYLLETERACSVEFQLHVPSHRIARLLHNGESAPFTLAAGWERPILQACLQESTHHEIRIEFEPALSDEHTVEARSFVWQAPPVVEREERSRADFAPIEEGSRLLSRLSERELAERTTAIDLSAHFNSRTLRLHSGWRLRGGEAELLFSGFVSGQEWLLTASGRFSIPSSPLRLLLVEQGFSDPYTRRPIRSDKPSRFAVPIGKAVEAISVLYANETESRHMDVKVGAIRLLYEDGESAEIPLIVGETFDTHYSRFAKLTKPVHLGGNDYLNAICLRCRRQSVLREAEFVIDALDAHMGLVAMSVIR